MTQLVNTYISGNDVTTHQGIICEVFKWDTAYQRISRGKHISPSV